MSWAAATIMAAIAGIFFSIKVRLGPDIWYVGLAGFAPALIGGMDSLKGVVIGAVIVATAEVLAAHLYRAAGRARRAVLGLTGRAVDQAVGNFRLARRA